MAMLCRDSLSSLLQSYSESVEINGDRNSCNVVGLRLRFLEIDLLIASMLTNPI